MASLTVRQLDDKLKKQLRLRAAKNGRSVEDEVRTILRSAAADADAFDRRPPTRRGKAEQPATAATTDAPHILLIIGGGIAAYKSLDLIRRLRERGIEVRVVMTDAAQKFITPLSVGAIAGEHPFTDLFDARSEFDVGHIRLARDPSLIVVAPATADLMAKMANGLADDLASAVLLATDKTIVLAPAMNPLMWSNKATRRNLRAAHSRSSRAGRTQRRRDGGKRRSRRRPNGGAARDRRGCSSAACGRLAGARRRSHARHLGPDP